MTSAGRAGQPKRRSLAFWAPLGLLFVTVSGISFLVQYFGVGESARSSAYFAVALAFVIIIYHVGYGEGRRDYEPSRESSMPSPKRR